MLQPISVTLGADELRKIDRIGSALNTNRSAVIRWLVQNTEFVQPTVRLRPEVYSQEERSCEQQMA